VQVVLGLGALGVVGWGGVPDILGLQDSALQAAAVVERIARGRTRAGRAEDGVRTSRLGMLRSSDAAGKNLLAFPTRSDLCLGLAGNSTRGKGAGRAGARRNGD
jgi:hypothetical protein